jgi:hypothetical protein
LVEPEELEQLTSQVDYSNDAPKSKLIQKAGRLLKARLKQGPKIPRYERKEESRRGLPAGSEVLFSLGS